MPPDTTQDYDIHLAHAVNDLMEFEQGKTLGTLIAYFVFFVLYARFLSIAFIYETFFIYF